MLREELGAPQGDRREELGAPKPGRQRPFRPPRADRLDQRPSLAVRPFSLPLARPAALLSPPAPHGVSDQDADAMRKLRGRQQTPSDHNADQVAAGLLLVQEDSGTDLDALLVLLDVLNALFDVLHVSVGRLLEVIGVAHITQAVLHALEREQRCHGLLVVHVGATTAFEAARGRLVSCLIIGTMTTVRLVRLR